MDKKKVFCERCADTVKNKEELITAIRIIDVVAYHEECFARDIKGSKTFILDNTPLNGFASNFITVIIVIIGLFFLLFASTPEKYISLFAIIPIFYRLYSYFMFERKLE